MSDSGRAISSWRDLPGPWNGEPDHKVWLDPRTGLLCVARRTQMGHWCGYVQAFGDAACDDYAAHGGITMVGCLAFLDKELAADAAKLVSDLDLVAGFSFVGFDCAHAGDLIPEHPQIGGEYRTLDYVYVQCSDLALQVAERMAEDG